MATMIVRDDFTGSGNISGRTPDGGGLGPWADSTFPVSIVPGLVGSGVFFLDDDSAPPDIQQHYGYTLLGEADAYVVGQGHLVASNTQTNSVSFGVRWNDGVPSGKASGVVLRLQNPGTGDTTVRMDVFARDQTTGNIVTLMFLDTFTVADPVNVVARLECEGDDVRAYLDGALVWSGTQTNVTGPGGVYAALATSDKTLNVNMGWIEAGSLGEPEPPATDFWTSFVGTHEVP